MHPFYSYFSLQKKKRNLPCPKRSHSTFFFKKYNAHTFLHTLFFFSISTQLVQKQKQKKTIVHNKVTNRACVFFVVFCFDFGFDSIFTLLSSSSSSFGSFSENFAHGCYFFILWAWLKNVFFSHTQEGGGASVSDWQFLGCSLARNFKVVFTFSCGIFSLSGALLEM